MAEEVSRLVLAVDSRGVRSATTDLEKFGQQGKRTEGSARGLGSAFQFLKGGIAGAVAALSVREIIQAADNYSPLNSRLKLVSASSLDFAKAQAEVFAISQRTSTGLEATADLYGSLARSTQSLGVSQAEVLGVTETINQALLVSGTGAQSAAAALVQLGQGFSSGALRGEELNSVLEQAPRLARAIADGLGVPVGALRKLGEQGKLTGAAVFEALQKSARGVAREAAQIPLTVGQATQQASNSLLKLIGTIDSTSGATKGLAGIIKSAADAVGELADEIDRASRGEAVGFLASAFQVISETVQVLAANIAFVFNSIGREIGAVAAQTSALLRGDIAGFKAISEAVKADGVRARAELDALERRLLVFGKGLRTQGSENDERRGRGFVAQPDPKIKPIADTGKTKALSEAQRYLENLQKQIEKTEELNRYEQALADIQNKRLDGITPKLAAQILATAKLADISQLTAKLAKDEAQALDDEATALRKSFADAYDEIRSKAAQFYESTRTPQEKLNADLAEQARLLEVLGDAYEDTYNRATGAAFARFDDTFKKQKVEIDETTKNFISGTQNIFANAFENIGTGGLKNLDKEFSALLLKLSAQAVAADLTKRLFGEDGKSIDDLGKRITEQIASIDLSSLSNSFGSLFADLGASISKLFSGGEGGFDLGALFGAAAGGSGGGGGGADYGSLLASVFGGAFADGGFAKPNKVALVGERGPELMWTGNRGMTVQPMASAPAQRPLQLVVNQSFAAGTDRSTVTQAAAQAARAIQAGQRNL